jgi:DNA/RNA non-specific endonuclease
MPRLITVARVEEWIGIEEVDPNFYFTVEDFAFDGDDIEEIRQRPTRAEGAVWGLEGQAPRREGDLPLADVRMDGTVSTRHDTFSYGGHLIAHRLTGVAAPANLVPVTQAANGEMKKVENRIAKKASPHWLVVEVGKYYDGAAEDPRVPGEFRYTLYEGGTRPTSYGNKKVLEQQVTQPWLNVGAYTYSQSNITEANRLHDEMVSKHWRIENLVQYHAMAPYLAPAAERPLAFLDYWVFTNGMHPVPQQKAQNYVKSIACGKGFRSSPARWRSGGTSCATTTCWSPTFTGNPLRS